MTISALIVAAGRGTRAGGDVPKQYADLCGRAVLRHALDRFMSCGLVQHVLVVIHADDAHFYERSIQGLEDSRLLRPVSGGATRGASVLSGLRRLAALDPRAVLIHDAARPFVSSETIARVVEALDDNPGAFAGLPVVDAIWSVDNGMANKPVSRDKLWRAQTPQGFRFREIVDAYRLSDGTAADDVAVARQAGLDVRVVPGDEQNFKITTTDDLNRARRIAAQAWSQ